ncbi:RNA-guided endonuclease InsQ/TnpB family protein [Microseira sp. BLCC-F43]|uniref:RNA-guided endonuclease InsQ/TnpB family protein n=1 Tax=Microseira sp. BLCC-F43 TaxID=3153602 RepID=UPI0035B6B29D
MTLTYEYKIEPTTQQITAIEHYLNVCRKVWTYALRERKEWLNYRKSEVNACGLISEYIIPGDEPYPNYVKPAKSLTDYRKKPELKSVNAQFFQHFLIKIETGVLDMSRKGMGFPRCNRTYANTKVSMKNPWEREPEIAARNFGDRIVVRKSCSRSRGECVMRVFPQFKTNPVKGDLIKLPELGWVKIRLSRPVPDGFKLKQVRIVKKASGYFAMLSLQCDVQVPDATPHGHPVGIDLGIQKFLATSDGELIALTSIL